MLSKNRYLSVMGLAAVAMLLVSGAESRAGDEPVLSEMRVAVPTVVAEDGYWLGVACGPMDAALRAHLDVPEGQGVIVNQVMEESPAEGGIHTHYFAGGFHLGSQKNIDP